MKKEIILSLVVALLVSGVYFFSQRYFGSQGLKGQEKRVWTEALQLEFANTLLSKGLSRQAAEAFEAYLDKTHAGNKDLSGVAYKVGNIYMDLGEFEKALRNFYKSEILEPNAEYKSELGQRIVEALENLGLSQQAKYELENRTSLNQAAKTQENIVARIGKKQITQSQIDAAIDRTPQWMRGELSTDEGKLKFIRQYVAADVLYDKAKRLGFDRSPNVIQAVDDYKKNIAVQALMQKEVEQGVKVDADDLVLYYKANKEKYVIPAKDKQPEKQLSFEEVKSQVENEYKFKKQQEVVNNLIDKSLEQQEVEILFKPNKENGGQKK
ncbi:MAG: hypothetical protein NTU54_05595 [Candidatus Omnitrophica bacterium]|nr:hypothetical protein [Candidatus Omnitrophota bacterium]